MKNSRLWLAVVLTLAIMPAAFADMHRANDVAVRFIDAWNAHDNGAMTILWTTDASGTDLAGTVATGRADVARLFSAGTSTLKVTSDISERTGPDGTSLSLTRRCRACGAPMEGRCLRFYATSGQRSLGDRTSQVATIPRVAVSSRRCA